MEPHIMLDAISTSHYVNDRSNAENIATLIERIFVGQVIKRI